MSSDLLGVSAVAATSAESGHNYHHNTKRVDVFLAAINRFMVAVNSTSTAKDKRAAARWLVFRFNSSENPGKLQLLDTALKYARGCKAPQEVIDILSPLLPRSD